MSLLVLPADQFLGEIRVLLRSAETQLRGVDAIVNRLAIDSDSESQARAILRLASSMVHPNPAATELFVQLLPLYSRPHLVLETIAQICSGSESEIAQVFDACRELIRGGHAATVALLGASADLCNTPSSRQQLLDMVRDAFEVAHLTEYPALLRTALRSAAGGATERNQSGSSSKDSQDVSVLSLVRSRCTSLPADMLPLVIEPLLTVCRTVPALTDSYFSLLCEAHSTVSMLDACFVLHFIGRGSSSNLARPSNSTRLIDVWQATAWSVLVNHLAKQQSLSCVWISVCQAAGRIPTLQSMLEPAVLNLLKSALHCPPILNPPVGCSYLAVSAFALHLAPVVFHSFPHLRPRIVQLLCSLAASLDCSSLPASNMSDAPPPPPPAHLAAACLRALDAQELRPFASHIDDAIYRSPEFHGIAAALLTCTRVALCERSDSATTSSSQATPLFIVAQKLLFAGTDDAAQALGVSIAVSLLLHSSPTEPQHPSSSISQVLKRPHQAVLSPSECASVLDWLKRAAAEPSADLFSSSTRLVRRVVASQSDNSKSLSWASMMGISDPNSVLHRVPRAIHPSQVKPEAIRSEILISSPSKSVNALNVIATVPAVPLLPSSANSSITFVAALFRGFKCLIPILPHQHVLEFYQTHLMPRPAVPSQGLGTLAAVLWPSEDTIRQQRSVEESRVTSAPQSAFSAALDAVDPAPKAHSPLPSDVDASGFCPQSRVLFHDAAATSWIDIHSFVWRCLSSIGALDERPQASQLCGLAAKCVESVSSYTDVLLSAISSLSDDSTLQVSSLIGCGFRLPLACETLFANLMPEKRVTHLVPRRRNQKASLESSADTTDQDHELWTRQVIERLHALPPSAIYQAAVTMLCAATVSAQLIRVCFQTSSGKTSTSVLLRAICHHFDLLDGLALAVDILTRFARPKEDKSQRAPNTKRQKKANVEKDATLSNGTDDLFESIGAAELSEEMLWALDIQAGMDTLFGSSLRDQFGIILSSSHYEHTNSNQSGTLPLEVLIWAAQQLPLNCSHLRYHSLFLRAISAACPPAAISDLKQSNKISAMNVLFSSVEVANAANPPALSILLQSSLRSAGALFNSLPASSEQSSSCLQHSNFIQWLIRHTRVLLRLHQLALKCDPERDIVFAGDSDCGLPASELDAALFAPSSIISHADSWMSASSLSSLAAHVLGLHMYLLGAIADCAQHIGLHGIADLCSLKELVALRDTVASSSPSPVALLLLSAPLLPDASAQLSKPEPIEVIVNVLTENALLPLLHVLSETSDSSVALLALQAVYAWAAPAGRQDQVAMFAFEKSWHLFSGMSNVDSFLHFLICPPDPSIKPIGNKPRFLDTSVSDAQTTPSEGVGRIVSEYLAAIRDAYPSNLTPPSIMLLNQSIAAQQSTRHGAPITALSESHNYPINAALNADFLSNSAVHFQQSRFSRCSSNSFQCTSRHAFGVLSLRSLLGTFGCLPATALLARLAELGSQQACSRVFSAEVWSNHTKAASPLSPTASVWSSSFEFLPAQQQLVSHAIASAHELTARLLTLWTLVAASSQPSSTVLYRPTDNPPKEFALNPTQDSSALISARPSDGVLFAVPHWIFNIRRWLEAGAPGSLAAASFQPKRRKADTGSIAEPSPPDVFHDTPCIVIDHASVVSGCVLTGSVALLAQYDVASTPFRLACRTLASVFQLYMIARPSGSWPSEVLPSPHVCDSDLWTADFLLPHNTNAVPLGTVDSDLTAFAHGSRAALEAVLSKVREFCAKPAMHSLELIFQDAHSTATLLRHVCAGIRDQRAPRKVPASINQCIRALNRFEESLMDIARTHSVHWFGRRAKKSAQLVSPSHAPSLMQLFASPK